MSKQRLSLMDVLNPPVNPWLKEISQRNAKVPAGVRVVRLGGEEDDDPLDQALTSRVRRSAASTGQGA